MSNPPLSTLSDDNESILSDYLSDVIGTNWWRRNQTVSFLLYLFGEKPAVEFTMLSSESISSDAPVVSDSIPPEDACDGFLALVAKLDVPHHRQHRELSDGFDAVIYECVYDETDALPPAEAVDTEEDFHRKWGSHYGYPESAIEGFINDNSLHIFTSEEDCLRFYEIIDSIEYSFDDAKRLGLISFVPPATVDGVVESIERGLHYESVLRQLAESNGCQLIEDIVDSLLLDFGPRLAVRQGR